MVVKKGMEGSGLKNDFGLKCLFVCAWKNLLGENIVENMGKKKYS